MALERRLKRWTEAGLLDARQAERILEFEQGRDRPTLMYAVAGLGGLAIAIGIVSIVAANWDVIPGRVKIATNLMLLVGGGATLARYFTRWPIWARDAALLVMYGLTMGSIALVGQVYQLGGTAREALATWSVLTAPLMTLGGTEFVALLWLFGLQGTCAAWLIWLAEQRGSAEGWALTGASLLPWLLLFVGHSPWLQRARPAYAKASLSLGWFELVIAASVGANVFYTNQMGEPWNALWAGLALASAMAAWIWIRLTALQGGKVARWLLVGSLLLIYLPARLSPGGWDLLAALLFISLWLLVAYAAHSAQIFWILNLATAVLGVRILIVYFEVFGSLLSTGFGLVSGGALTLLLTWLWWRTRRRFKEERST